MAHKKPKRKANNMNKRLANTASGAVMRMRESEGKDEAGNYGWTSNMSWDNCELILKTPMRWYIHIWVKVKDQEELLEQVIASPQCYLKDLQGVYSDIKTKLSLMAEGEIVDRGWTARPLTRRLKAKLDQQTEVVT